MRLTNEIRDAFVRGVMKDVPQEDYDTQLRDLAMKKAVARLPEKVRAIWKDASIRDYITTGRINVQYKYIDGLPGVTDYGTWIGEDPPNEWFNDLKDLVAASKRQDEKIMAVEAKVRAVAYSCTTRKQLLEALPEFEKYLPEVAPKASDLPAVANLVKDLVELGWPDGGKKSAEVVAA